MIRTQVYLTEEQALHIKALARRERRKQAEVIRELVDKGLTTSIARKHTTTSEFLAGIEALNLSGPTDLSTNHDDYLYGDKE
jgi:hypothetical protein